jgi:hypothetical protein
MSVTTEVFEITHSSADVWVARDDLPGVNYAYGGTRMVKPHMDSAEISTVLSRLMYYESSFKNHLINHAIRQGAVNDYADALPAGFLESVVGGARCIIRPRTAALASVLKDPRHPEFQATIAPIFQEIGVFLNKRGGDIKLTPDFGRFAGLSDLLAEFTPHVLGIRCEAGGCGGKSSYSTSGIIAALQVHNIAAYKHQPITLIGSAGALGVDVLAWFESEGYTDIAVCDLVYDDPASGVTAPDGHRQLPSRKKAFTDACLRRGGVIVATTVGEELENSNWELMPEGTLLFLAHNLAIPAGEAGTTLMDKIAARGVYAVPGQVLTLGGALTSRVEWFWRQARVNEPFDKPLAHTVVRRVVSFLVAETDRIVRAKGVTPYKASVEIAQTELIEPNRI